MIINNDISFLDSINVEISASKHIVLDKKWRHDTFSSPFSRLYFVKRGNGFLKCKDKTINMNSGYVYFVPAECEFSYGCTELEKLFFHVSITTPEGYDLFSNVNRICVLPVSDKEYDEFYKYHNPESYHGILKLKTMLVEIFMKFAKEYNFEEKPIKQYSPLVMSAIDYIQDNLNAGLAVSEISDSLFVSESKLRNVFKEEMDIPIGKYIDDMVLKKAKHYLSDGNLSIAEISSRLGFCDQFYFARRFKEKFNQTPSFFKKCYKT